MASARVVGQFWDTAAPPGLLAFPEARAPEVQRGGAADAVVEDDEDGLPGTPGHKERRVISLGA